jgi:pentatricopeptide repeat protein
MYFNSYWILDQQIRPNVTTFNIILHPLLQEDINNYGKVLNLMKNYRIAPDIGTYNTILTGLAHHGKVEEIIQIAEQVFLHKKQKFRPDNITCLVVINALKDAVSTQKILLFFRIIKIIIIFEGTTWRDGSICSQIHEIWCNYSCRCCHYNC